MIDSEFLESLQNATSATGGTSLLTYYVPPQTEMHLVSTHFTTELASASNIKDRAVREGVKTALRSVLQTLKSSEYRTTPENGLVVLAGELASCV